MHLQGLQLGVYVLSHIIRQKIRDSLVIRPSCRGPKGLGSFCGRGDEAPQGPQDAGLHLNKQKGGRGRLQNKRANTNLRGGVYTHSVTTAQSFSCSQPPSMRPAPSPSSLNRNLVAKRRSQGAILRRCCILKACPVVCEVV